MTARRVQQAASQLPWQHVHFVGIGGVGMAGLAHIVADWGSRVTGTDRVESAMTRSLERRGVHVRIGHDPTQVQGADAVVYSSAVPPENAERRAAAAAGIPSWCRGAFLAELARQFETVIAVGGSHGKTTTTAMIAHCLRECGREPGCLVGGMVCGWDRSARRGAGRMLVTEVDESDGTQALMHSSVAVITNVDDDHSWSLGGIEALQRNFGDFARQARQVVAFDTPVVRDVLHGLDSVHWIRDVRPQLEQILKVPGRHNRLNASFAVAACVSAGVDEADAVQALASFCGVDRRLSVRYRGAEGRVLVVEDYAHHPTELQATLDALRESWPEHRLIVVFQPHRFERVKRYGAEFGRLLCCADAVHIIPPFAAWMSNTDLADPQAIANAVQGPACTYWDHDLEAFGPRLAETLGPDQPTLIAIIGAGDVHDLVAPVVQAVEQRDRIADR